ncbi:hypothetical protein QN363_20410, partial [Undibacterium sp. CCC2.1]
MNEELDVKKDDNTNPAKKIKEVSTPVKSGLKTKEAIVANWLPRYTGRPLDAFGEYIILTNFSKYLHLFSEWHN